MGAALQKGLGSTHAMANPLGELHFHHGTLIGILLPHVIAFNSVSGDRLDELGVAAGLPADRTLAGWTTDLVRRLGRRSRFVNWVSRVPASRTSPQRRKVIFRPPIRVQPQG